MDLTIAIGAQLLALAFATFAGFLFGQASVLRRQTRPSTPVRVRVCEYAYDNLLGVDGATNLETWAVVVWTQLDAGAAPSDDTVKLVVGACLFAALLANELPDLLLDAPARNTLVDAANQRLEPLGVRVASIDLSGVRADPPPGGAGTSSGPSPSSAGEPP